MANRFKNPILKQAYDNCIKMFETKHETLFNKGGFQSAGNGIANSFWKGYNGTVFGAGWDAESKDTLAYAYWRAGEDISKRITKAKPKPETSQMVGRYKLVEKEKYGDTVCFIYLGKQKLGVYCSIPDAMRHQCEWNEDCDGKLS